MNTPIKAVIFDIDGTVMANQRHAMPTKRVIEAVAAAKAKGLYMSCATGRNYEVASHILRELSITDPCIVSAGTQIVEPQTGKELWSAYMIHDDVEYALSVLDPYDLKALVDGDTYETAQKTSQITRQSYRMIDVQYIPKEHLPTILEALRQRSSLSAIPVDSHDPELFFLHVTSDQATKEHAVVELLRILGVEKSHAAAVGDGLNDIELFKSAGLKAAMGNARNELKAVADVVLPSVDDDGFAQFLEELNV